jgi:hypothetical protein
MMNSGNNADVVLTKLDKVFKGPFDVRNKPGYASSQTAILFNQDTTDRAEVQTEVTLPPGQFSSHLEEQEVEVATVRTDNYQTHTIVNYKKALKIPVEFFDDDQHNVVDDTIRLVGTRAMTTQDKAALAVYRDGFTSVTTGDGSTVFANTHTTLNGGTVDNLEITAFSQDTMEVLDRRLLEQPHEDDDLAAHSTAFLLVPPALWPDANEITRSTLKSDTGNNALNYFSLTYPGMQVFQSPYLGSAYGGSNTAAFVGSQMHTVTRIVREELVTRLVDWTFDDQDRYTYKSKFREVDTVVAFWGLVATLGTS